MVRGKRAAGSGLRATVTFKFNRRKDLRCLRAGKERCDETIGYRNRSGTGDDELFISGICPDHAGQG